MLLGRRRPLAMGRGCVGRKVGRDVYKRQALRKANVDPPMLDAVAATRGPGLPSALLVGLKAGQALAFSLRKPVIGIHHHEAHLYSPWISGDPPRAHFARFEPSVSLIVSGGHTLLVAVTEMFNHRVLGGTLDDAAGECFDKTGKLMGLAYPAGPEIDRLAAAGNPRTHNFPRPMPVSYTHLDVYKRQGKCNLHHWNANNERRTVPS